MPIVSWTGAQLWMAAWLGDTAQEANFNCTKVQKVQKKFVICFYSESPKSRNLEHKE